MLKTTKEFDFVYKNSYKFRSESLDICVLRANMAGQFYEKFRRLPCNLVGFSVSKKVGNAVERNLVKRRLRAICREFFNVCNSSLGASCVDLANFGRSQTLILVSRPKFAKNSTTSTANTRIVVSNVVSTASSLRGRIVNLHEAIQNNEVDCHENSLRSFSRNDESTHDSALPNLAMTGNSANCVKSSNVKLGLQKDNAQNLICIFIAKSQILQTPFATLKSTIFATLKRQLNFKKNSHTSPRNFSANRPQTKAKQNENR